MSSSDFEKTHVFYLHETWGQSFARDLTTVGFLLAVWLPGYLIGSSALQWVGVVLWIIFAISRLKGVLDKTVKNRMTPDEARKWLDENFPND